MARKETPANLDAEEALLGAMLIPRGEAVTVGLDAVSADDFFKPEHGMIYRAIARVYASGAVPDPVTVAAELDNRGELDRVGGRKALLGMQAATPASFVAASYAAIVAQHASLRRSITLATSLSEAAYDRDLERVEGLIDTAQRALAPPVGDDMRLLDLDDAVTLADADDLDPGKPWLIPSLFRELETLILTGGEGWGKATLLRQIGVCVASGIHPFLSVAEKMPDPTRVLYVDLQEDTLDAAHELRPLRRRAGDMYVKGMFRFVTRPQGLNILAARDRRWLESVIADHDPSLVLMGPLVRMFRGTDRASRMSEDIVDEVTDALDALRVQYSFGLMLEGHAGNERDGEDAWRVRGSSVWRSWPAFGLGMAPVLNQQAREVDLKHWRQARHADRPWPSKLFGGKGGWPWSVSSGDYERIARACDLGWLIDGAAVQEEIF